jgi:CsoR family transcriptional regulator, copper-sensing transcriptional repressor
MPPVRATGGGAERRSVQNRLASAHGHLGAVRRMAADGDPCPQIVYQLRAIRSALAQVEQILVRQHLHHCLASTSPPIDTRLLSEIVELWEYNPGRGAGGRDAARLPGPGARSSQSGGER